MPELALALASYTTSWDATVLSNRLSVLAAEIKRTHVEGEAAATTAAELAMEAGTALLEANTSRR